MKCQTYLILVSFLFFFASSHAQELISLNESDYSRASIQTNENISESNFFYKYTQARPFKLNPAILSLQKNKTESLLQLDLFPSEEFTASIKRIRTDVNQTTTITAAINNHGASYAIISMAKDGTYSVTIEITDQSKSFATRLHPNSGNLYLVEIDKEKEVVLSCNELPVAKAPGQEGENTHKVDQAPTPHKMATAELDLLVLYTSDAENYAISTQGSMNNYLATLVSSSQTVLDNSEIDANLNLVHSALTSYNESGDSGQDLSRLRIQGDGFMDEAHTLRDTYYADLVMLVSLTNDTGGIAYLLNNTNGSPNFGFSLVRVQQPVSSYTFMHELGHNMGCGHHADQNFQAGPGLFSYSAGGRWTSTNGGEYCSIMSYESGSFYSDGVSHDRVPHFSNPNVNYIGVATGNATTADNARNNEFTKLLIEDYRIAPGGSPTLAYQSNTIDDDTNGASNGNDNGIPEGGESIQLSVELQNTGTTGATNVSAVLSTADADITITDADLDWSDIAAGDSATASDFTFDIASGTIEKDVTFTLNITSDEGSWSDTFTIGIFEEPGETVLAYQSSTIDDDTSGASNGNDNGIPEGGESIQLSVELQNTGTAGATNVSAVLSTVDADITITDADLDWNDIAAGNAATASDFTFDIASGTIEKDVTFTLNITSDEGSWSDTFTIGIFEEPGETVLAYQSSTIDDDTNGASNGNGNGIPEGGESIQLSVELQNTGTTGATNVSAVLSTADADITITDADLDWNDIAAGDSATASDFTFDIASGTIEKDVTFTLNITSDEGSWSDTFTIGIFEEPGETVLAYQSSTIDDDTSGASNGNGNGIPEGGESIQLSVELQNTGTADATNVSAVLSTADADITITDADLDWNDIAAGDSASASDFTFDIASGTIEKDVTFTLNITSDEGSWSDDFIVTIGNAPAMTAIPDVNFEQVLIDLSLDDEIDGAVLTTNISNVTTLGLQDSNIADLTGIEDFLSLQELDVSNNVLSEINLEQNGDLLLLNCAANMLTALNISENTALETLDLSGNQVDNVNLEPNTALLNVNISGNPVATLTLSNSIAVLNCSDTGLSSLVVNQLTALTTLQCANNALTTLDLSDNVNFVNLNSRNNSLTSIDLRNGNHANFEVIDVGENPELRCIYVNDPENVSGEISTDGTNAIFVENEAACEALSVPESALTEIVLYPNPTDGIVTIDGIERSEISTITIYDALGRRILTTQSSDQIDMRTLESGLYAIIIKDSQQNTASFKIIRR